VFRHEFIIRQKKFGETLDLAEQIVIEETDYSALKFLRINCIAFVMITLLLKPELAWFLGRIV